MHNAMSPVDRKKIESELNAFALRNFEKPADCKDLEQIRFYVRELCLKIEELEKRFEYVPNSAYQLLAQYNSKQNAIINKDFTNSYKAT
jgi:hypothetical protein